MNPSLKAPPQAFLFDLLVYVSVMFLIRSIYVPEVSFIANGLFWSLTTLVVASWRMRVRGVSWHDLGLCKPDSLYKTLITTACILGLTVLLVFVFQLAKDSLGLELKADRSEQAAAGKFGNLHNNWLLFLTTIPFIWLQSALEELLDRGFLINWFERLLANRWFATTLAVLAQATLFGFRHSYDLSERSVSVALIGLAMGIGYVTFGRNLWPLILAHCLLNTMSMLERV